MTKTPLDRSHGKYAQMGSAARSPVERATKKLALTLQTALDRSQGDFAQL